eukprot:tig00021168_g19115.t1
MGNACVAPPAAAGRSLGGHGQVALNAGHVHDESYTALQAHFLTAAVGGTGEDRPAPTDPADIHRELLILSAQQAAIMGRQAMLLIAASQAALGGHPFPISLPGTLSGPPGPPPHGQPATSTLPAAPAQPAAGRSTAAATAQVPGPLQQNSRDRTARFAVGDQRKPDSEEIDASHRRGTVTASSGLAQLQASSRSAPAASAAHASAVSISQQAPPPQPHALTSAHLHASRAPDRERPLARDAPRTEWTNVRKSDYLKDPIGTRARTRRLRIVPDPSDVVRLNVPRSSSGWATIRIFVSSTFKDMHGERDHLTRTVFPELNERAKALKVRILPVDLRWGLTKEDTSDSGVGALELCLEEIDRCNHWILVLGGERYGWIPDQYKVSKNSKWDWLRELEHGHSITALEIEYGILNRKDKHGGAQQVHAFIYIRDPSFMEHCELADREIFLDENRAKQAALMESCRRHRYCIVLDGYPCGFERVTRGKDGKATGGYTSDLGDWGRQVYDDLWEALMREFPDKVDVELDARQIERNFHDLVISQRAHNFLGRGEMLQAIETFVYGKAVGKPVASASMSSTAISLDAAAAAAVHVAADAGGHILVVYGQRGCGKTALLAKFCSSVPETERRFFVAHFIGASPASLAIRRTLRRLCLELLHIAHGQDAGTALEPIPEVEQYEALKKLFSLALEKAAGAAERHGHRLVLCLDAVSALDEADHAHMVDWLPCPLPAGVRLVASTADNTDDGEVHPVRAAFQQRADHPAELMVGAFENAMQKALIEATLSEYHKTLDAEQLKLLLRKQAAQNPLFLSVICEEIRVFGVFEDLTEHIRKMPDTLPEMFACVLERLESEHGRELVEKSLCFLTVSKNGLLENELLELLSRRGEVQLPRAFWARLFRSLEFYLRPPGESGEGAIDFYFTQLREAVQTRYLHDPRVERNYYHRLADYLRRVSWTAKASFFKVNNLSRRFRLCVRILQALNRFRRPLLKKGARKPFNIDTLTKGTAFAKLMKTETPHRVLELLPYSLVGARMWQMLDLVLTNLRFIEQKARAGMTFELVADYLRFEKYVSSVREADRERASRGVRSSEYGEGSGAGDSEDPSNSEAGEIPGESNSTNRDAKSAIGEFSHERTEETRYPDLEIQQRIAQFQAFVQRASHILSKEPALAFQMAFNQPDHTAPFRDAKERLDTNLEERSFIVHHNKPQTVDACVMTLTAHQDFVWALSISYHPQRPSFATACWDSNLKVFDAVTGQEIVTLSGHAANARCIAFSRDGRYLVSGGGDRLVHVHDVQSGREIMKGQGHTDVVWGAAFAPDGTRCLSAGEDRVCRIWDLQSKSVVEILRGHTEWCRACDWSPDGLFIATAADDETLRIYSGRAEEKYALITVLAGHTNVVRGCAFSPDTGDTDGDGSMYTPLLASCSGDRTIKVWDCFTYACIRTLRGHSGLVHCVRWSPDGKTLVSSSLDRTIRLWDWSANECLAVLSGHLGNVRSVAYLPDRKQLVSASDDCTIKFWDPSTAQSTGRRKIVLDKDPELAAAADDLSACVNTLTGHGSFVWSIAISPDGTRVVSTCWDGTARVWSVTRGKLLCADMKMDRNIRCCAWAPKTQRHPGGPFIATGSGDATIKIWETKNYREIAHLKGHKDVVWGVHFSPNASKLVSASEDRTLKIWDTGSWTEIGVLNGHYDWVRSVCFSPDGDFIVSGADDETIKVWDAYLCQCTRTLRGHKGVLRCSNFTSDSDTIISSGGDKIVKIWSIRTGTCMATLHGHTKIVNWVEQSPDKQYLATASSDGDIKIFDYRTGACVTTLRGHARDVRQARFAYSAQEKYLVSCSDDGSIRLWDMKKVEEWHANHRDIQKAAAGTLEDVIMQIEAEIETGKGTFLRSLGEEQEEMAAKVVVVAEKPKEKQQKTQSIPVQDALDDVDVAENPPAAGVIAELQASPAVASVVRPRSAAPVPKNKNRSTAMNMSVYRNSQQFASARKLGHTSFVWALSCSADGKLAMTAGWDSKVILWDIESGAMVRELIGHTANVRGCAFSPDCNYAATVGGDRHLMVFKVSSGERINSIARAHDEVIWAVAWAPDSHVLATASEDRTLRVWTKDMNKSTDATKLVTRAADGKEFAHELPVELKAHTDWVRAVAFSNDGRLMASASDDETVIVWDTVKWQSVTVLHGHSAPVRGVAFSPDSKVVVSSSADRTIKAYDISRWALIKTFRGHQGVIHSVRFSNDGSLLCSCSLDESIKVWDFMTRKCVASIEGREKDANRRGHVGNVRGCTFVGDSRNRLVTGGDDCTGRVWDIQDAIDRFQRAAEKDRQGGVKSVDDGDADLEYCLRTLPGHSSFVWSVCVSADGSRILSTCWDATAKLWDVGTGKEIPARIEHEKNIRCCDWAPATKASKMGPYFATGSGDKTVKVWNSTTLACVAILKEHKDVVWGCCFNPTCTVLASASEDRAIMLFDVATWQCKRVLTGHLDWCRLVTFNPSGTLILTCSDDETLKIWDSESGSEVATLSGHVGVLRCGAFNPNGSMIASASGDKTVKLWDVITGRCVATLNGHRKIVNWCEFSPDGKYVVSASGDGEVKIWDASTCELVETLKGHNRDVHAARFIGETKLVSASDDMTLKIWDFKRAIANRQQPLGPSPVSKTNSKANSAQADNSSRSSSQGPNGRPLQRSDSNESLLTDKGSLIDSLHEEEDQSPEALDAAERRRLQKRNGSHKAGVMCVRWSKTGQWFATGSRDRSIRVFNSEGLWQATLRGHGGVVKSVAVAPSDAYIASGSWDRTLRIWATSISGSYEQLAQIGGHSGIIHSVGWSPDGRLLVSGSEDRTMRIWEIKTDGGGWVSGKETKVVSGLAPNVTSCFFAGDGRRLIASVGNAIKIFDVGSGCKELRSAIVSDAPIKCLSVDDTVQGRTRLVASCEAGGRDVVRVYEVEAMIQSDKARFSEYSVQGLGERSAAHVHAYGDATKRTTASPRSVVACAFYNPPAAVSEAAIELRPNVVVASDPGKLLSTHTDAGQRVCAFEGFAPFTCVDSCGARIAAGDFVGNVYALSSVLFQ